MSREKIIASQGRIFAAVAMETGCGVMVLLKPFLPDIVMPC